MFTFKNGRGVKDDGNGGCHNHVFDTDVEGRRVSGVSINHNIVDMKCTYCIAGVHSVSKGGKIHSMLYLATCPRYTDVQLGFF
jgi:hypothetical protein